MRRLIISAAILLFSVPALALGSGQPKVGICHATESRTNPYVYIEVATKAALRAHIDRETGNLHGSKIGNFDFYAEDASECVVDSNPTTEPTPTPTTSVTPSATPTVTPTATPSATPSGTPVATPKGGGTNAGTQTRSPIAVPNTSIAR